MLKAITCTLAILAFATAAPAQTVELSTNQGRTKWTGERLQKR